MFSTAPGCPHPGLLDIHNHGGASLSYDENAWRHPYDRATPLRARHHSPAHLSGHRFPRRSDPPPDSCHSGRTRRAPQSSGSTSRAHSSPASTAGHTIRPSFAILIRTWSSGFWSRPTALCAKSRWRPSRTHSPPSRRASCARRVWSWQSVIPRRLNRPSGDRGRGDPPHSAFNGMPGVHHRAPGPVLAFVENPDGWLELINDGVHVRPEVIRMLCRLAPGRVALVSDAMAAAGTGGDGRYRIGNLDVDVAEGVARLTGEKALAGSTLTLDVAVALAVQDVGLSPLAAIEAATVPAQILGVDDRFGRLQPGYVADAVLSTGTGRCVASGSMGGAHHGSDHQQHRGRGRDVGRRRHRRGHAAPAGCRLGVATGSNPT